MKIPHSFVSNGRLMSKRNSNQTMPARKRLRTKPGPGRRTDEVADLAAGVAEMKVEEKATVEGDVDAVIDHRRREDGKWTWHIRWTDGTDEWVRDEDCNCEERIATYLRARGIHTTYCFARVSSKRQAGAKHVSLGSQGRRMMRAVDRAGIGGRIKLVEAASSAYKSVPRALREIVDAAGEGDTIMVYRADRLSRNVIEFLAWMEEAAQRGVRFVSTSEGVSYSRGQTRIQNLRFVQLIVAGSMESAAISDRVNASLEERRRRGDEAVGSLPYGKRYKRVNVGTPGEHLIVVDNRMELMVAQRIKRAERASNAPPVVNFKWAAELAETLNEEGNLKRGRNWSEAMIRAVCRSQIATAPLPRCEASEDSSEDEEDISDT